MNPPEFPKVLSVPTGLWLPGTCLGMGTPRVPVLLESVSGQPLCPCSGHGAALLGQLQTHFLWLQFSGAFKARCSDDPKSKGPRLSSITTCSSQNRN